MKLVRPSIICPKADWILSSVRVSMEEVASSRISIGGERQHHAGDAQKLLLALADAAAVLADHRVVACGQTADEAVGVGGFGGGDDFLLRGIRLCRRRCFPGLSRCAARYPARTMP